MRIIKEAAKIAALLSIAVAAIRLAQLFEAARRTAESVPSIVHAEAEAARRLIGDRLASLEARVDAQADLSRQMLDARLRDALALLDDHLIAAQLQVASATERAERQLAIANLGWAILVKNASDVLRPTAATMRVVQENAEVLGDCTGNPDCLANRAIGTMRAVEKSATSVAQAAPETTKAVRETASHVAELTRNLTKKPPLAWRVVTVLTRPLIWLLAQ